MPADPIAICGRLCVHLERTLANPFHEPFDFLHWLYARALRASRASAQREHLTHSSSWPRGARAATSRLINLSGRSYVPQIVCASQEPNDVHLRIRDCHCSHLVTQPSLFLCLSLGQESGHADKDHHTAISLTSHPASAEEL